MARKEQEQIEVESPREVESTDQQTQSGVMEIEINLQLLNQKINFIISKLDEVSNMIMKEDNSPKN